MYHDWRYIFEALTDSQIRQLLFAMYDYSETGVVTVFNDKMLAAMWIILHKQMSRDIEKYLITCETRSINKQIDYLKDDQKNGKNVSQKMQDLEEQKRFLKDNDYLEYTKKYKCTQVYTSDTPVTHDTDNVNGIGNDIENVNVTDTDNDSVCVNHSDKDIEKGIGENITANISRQLSASEIEQYYKDHNYSFDLKKCLKVKLNGIKETEIKDIFDFWQSSTQKQ